MQTKEERQAFAYELRVGREARHIMKMWRFCGAHKGKTFDQRWNMAIEGAEKLVANDIAERVA